MKRHTIALFTALALFAASAHAVRVLEILERSHELALADVTLPQSSGGLIGFKPCDSCAREYMPATPETRYFLRGQLVTLTELRQEANRIRLVPGTLNRTMVGLHYDPEKNVATRLKIETLQP